MILTPVAAVGRWTLGFSGQAAGVGRLFARTLLWVARGPFQAKVIRRASLFEQMTFVGVRSTSIVFFVALFTGIVLAMQSAYQLSRFGATLYVASLVAISVVRELGPVLVSLVVAGRVGAAITAELGTMKVTEQIEALETLALDPVRFLVVPRFLALSLMVPCLVILGDIVGMFGGWLIGTSILHINSSLYVDTTIKFLSMKDIATGLIKSFVFGMVIAMVACHQGLSTEGGAEGVGRSTTASVVTSFVLIILADCILTGLFYFSNV